MLGVVEAGERVVEVVEGVVKAEALLLLREDAKKDMKVGAFLYSRNLIFI